ncbi:MAG TPA: thioredoxin domain-containing protein [Marmoricola sp.]|nr:thioredoxin domain-containing protein [Marmoricola sp.]
MTIRVPRAAIYAILGGIVGLLIGGIAGFGVGRGTAPDGAAATGTVANVGPAAASSSPQPAQPQSSAPAVVPNVSTAGQPSEGPADAPVTIVEFTDFQCPFCGAFARDTEHALLAAYQGKVRFVIRDFPISGIHQYAEKAAEAAECAQDQGKFWPYHDVLFAHQDALDDGHLKVYAGQVGMDKAAFNRCLTSGSKAAVVAADMADGQRYGVSATPTFFINGQKVIGAKPLDGFKQVIDPILAHHG